MKSVLLIFLAFILLQCAGKPKTPKKVQAPKTYIPVTYSGELDLTKASVVLNDKELGKIIFSKQGAYFLSLASMSKEDQNKLPNNGFVVIYPDGSNLDFAMINLLTEKYKRPNEIEVVGKMSYLHFYGYEHARTIYYDSIHGLLEIHQKEWKSLQKELADKMTS